MASFNVLFVVAWEGRMETWIRGVMEEVLSLAGTAG
jgi:hypothetical protein